MVKLQNRDMQKASEFRVCKATGNRRSASMMGPGYFALMAINIQNGMILSGGGNYSLAPADSFAVCNAVRAVFRIAAPFCFYFKSA